MAKYVFASSTLLLTLYVNWIEARSWRDVQWLHDLDKVDDAGPAYLAFIEKLLLNESQHAVTPAPSDVFSDESSAPSLMPSLTPSLFPSDGPTNVPSDSPTGFPSSLPSNQPSDIPSELPSVSPTQDPYPLIIGPKEGERGYFNYDESTTSSYGPSMWGYVRLPQSFYWDEFGKRGYGPWKGTFRDRDFRKNVCDRGMKHQSPIDVFETMSGCNETHEIREHNGDFALSDTAVEKRIEANKLRIIFPRRPCADVNQTECQFPHPPWADFPNGFPGIADVIHIDLKIPSEHWLRGEQFDGEIQIYHWHAKNGRAVALSTLIRATEQGHNQHFQLALDAFQVEYDKNQAACDKNRNVGSNGHVSPFTGSNSTIFDATILPNTANTTTGIHPTNASYATNGTVSTNTLTENTTTLAATVNDTTTVGVWNQTRHQRDLHNIPNAWNPYHPDIMPTIYFYRYEGSMTEPPCSEFVTWHINDTPFQISLDQLKQWRTIQFTNIDATFCRRTSVHNSARSVARPIRTSPDRVVTKCTIDDFGPDLVRSHDY